MLDQNIYKNKKIKKKFMELKFMELEFHLNCSALIKTKNSMKTSLQGFKTPL